MAALVMLALQIPSVVLAEGETDYAGYFPGRDELTCVAIGGSITEAGGTTKSWGKYFSDWLNEKTGKKVNFYNKGVGGTDSSYGLARLYSDVSSLAPDIVFVEFSVNDRTTHNESAEPAPGQENTPVVFNPQTKSYELPVDDNGNQYLIYNEYKYTYKPNMGAIKNVHIKMESITRQLLSLPKKPVIIFNYVGFGTSHIANTASDNNRIGRLVMPRACKELHQEVADKYGIPSIDIDSYIQNIMVNGAAALNGNTYTQNEIYSATDCIHPNTTIGTKLYADYMTDVVSKDPDKYLIPVNTSVSDIEKYADNIYDDNFHTIPYTEAKLSGNGWRETTYNNNNSLKSENTGDSLSFDFEGNVLYVRGAKAGGTFDIKITNADSDGNDLEKTVTVAKSEDRSDLIYTNTELASGKHTVTITRTSGIVAINGITVNGAVPENGFKTVDEFRNEYIDQLGSALGGFSNTFDDLTGVVDSGWTKDDEITWEIADGKLLVKGAKDKGIHHKIEDNSYDIIYMGFDVTVTPSVGIRIWNETTNKEILGMIYGNDAGVFTRDANFAAARFSDTAKWWLSPGEHRFELLLNYKNNDFKLHIDGVESKYINGQKSEQGGTTLAGTGLGDIKIVLSDQSNVGIYLDNFELIGYDSYASKKISELNIYDSNIEKNVAEVEKMVEYLENNGKAVNSDAKAKLAEIKNTLEEIKTKEGTLTPSANNSNIKNAPELFTYGCSDIGTIKINGKTLTESTDYSVNKNKILFEGNCFAEAGNYFIEITSADGKEYLDNIAIREPQIQEFPILTSDNVYAKGVIREGVSKQGTNSQITGCRGNSALVYQAYNSGEKEQYASITFAGREEFKGTYKVEWFDVDGTIIGSNGVITQYAMPVLNTEINSAKGTTSFDFDTTRDNTWHDLGTYTFNGTDDEHIKIKSGVVMNNMSAGKRFFGEIIRLTEACDISAIYSEFAELPENIVISEGSNNSEYTNTARIINLSADIDDKYIDRIEVNGSASAYDRKGTQIYLSNALFAAQGDYTVKLVLINGTESNTLSFSLKNPKIIDYKLSQAELSAGVPADRAGANHSRHGENPTKVTRNNIAALPEGTALDDYVYVKWNIGNIKEGDYLIDTWLNSGRLALECKAEVSYNGGTQKKIYNSIHSNCNATDSYITEFYFGNGDSVHFTGEGDEYIKIMLDDDWEKNSSGAYFIIDSIRLTEYYDMNSVCDEFYGNDVITADEINVKAEDVTDPDGNPAKVNILSSVLTTKYPMDKYGYTAYLAVYDDSGKLTNVMERKNVMIYNGKKEYLLRFNLDMGGIDLTDKTYKIFLWGGDAEVKDTSMIPYLK